MSIMVLGARDKLIEAVKILADAENELCDQESAVKSLNDQLDYAEKALLAAQEKYIEARKLLVGRVMAEER